MPRFIRKEFFVTICMELITSVKNVSSHALQDLLAGVGMHGIRRGRYDVFFDDKRGQSPPTTSAFAPAKIQEYRGSR